MKCIKCGADMVESAKFCHICGHSNNGTTIEITQEKPLDDIRADISKNNTEEPIISSILDTRVNWTGRISMWFLSILMAVPAIYLRNLHNNNKHDIFGDFDFCSLWPLFLIGAICCLLGSLAYITTPTTKINVYEDRVAGIDAIGQEFSYTIYEISRVEVKGFFANIIELHGPNGLFSFHAKNASDVYSVIMKIKNKRG